MVLSRCSWRIFVEWLWRETVFKKCVAKNALEWEIIRTLFAYLSTVSSIQVWLSRKLPFMAYCRIACPHGKLPLNRRQEVTANKFIFFSWKVFLHLFLSHYASVFQNVRRFLPGLICWPHTDNKFISNYHNYVNPRHCIWSQNVRLTRDMRPLDCISAIFLFALLFWEFSRNQFLSESHRQLERFLGFLAEPANVDVHVNPQQHDAPPINLFLPWGNCSSYVTHQHCSACKPVREVKDKAMVFRFSDRVVPRLQKVGSDQRLALTKFK